MSKQGKSSKKFNIDPLHVMSLMKFYILFIVSLHITVIVNLLLAMAMEFDLKG